MKLAIVVPCYNEEQALPETARRLITLLDRLSAAGTIEPGSRLYFVDDGSVDRTWELIERLNAGDARVCGISGTGIHDQGKPPRATRLSPSTPICKTTSRPLPRWSSIAAKARTSCSACAPTAAATAYSSA
jgi:cellulose synthase/poly-beta-1,6-N-acetylglucosamine synthase-like glycosyltransferase